MEPPRLSQSGALGTSPAPHWLASASIAGMALTVVCAPAVSRAQAPALRAEAASRQAEALQRNLDTVRSNSQKGKDEAPAAPQSDLPETYPGENADLGPQVLLKPKAAPQRKPLFEFSSDTTFTRTDNVLSAVKRQPSTTALESLSLTFSPEPFEVFGKKLSLSTGYRHLFWFADVANNNGGNGTSPNASNFELSTVFFNASYAFAENWSASLGLDYNQLLTLTTDSGDGERPNYLAHVGSIGDWKETITEWIPKWSLVRDIKLLEKLNLALGYNGSYHFSNGRPALGSEDYALGNSNYVRRYEKVDSVLTATLIYSPLKKIVILPGFSWANSSFRHPQYGNDVGRRQDISTTSSVSVIWSPLSRLSVRFSWSREFRRSNDESSSPTTHKRDFGGGVTCSVKF